MDRVRFGIIGAGNMGTTHAAYLRRGDVARCSLTAVCDVNTERLKAHKDLKVFTDSRALIRSGEVDAVLIATPHYDHTPIGVDALEQGVHVLVEKPISVHKADCERLTAAHAARPELKFGAMFQMRTYPIFKKLKQLIANGEIGELQRMNWIATAWFRSEAYYASGGWRATWQGEGGGVLLNQCPHNLDLFQWLCGLPSEVTSFCSFGKHHRIETEDEVTAFLRYPNGATGAFITSTGESPGTDRLEIVGDRGTIILEAGLGELSCDAEQIRLLRNEIGTREFSAKTQSQFGKPDAWECRVSAPGTTRAHADITQNFVDAILDDTALIAPAEEGVKSVEMANAMLLSAWTGSPVSLPLDGAAYARALQERIHSSTFVKETLTDTGVADLSDSFH